MSLDRVQVAKLAVIGVAGLTLYEQLSYHIKSKFTIPGLSVFACQQAAYFLLHLFFFLRLLFLFLRTIFCTVFYYFILCLNFDLVLDLEPSLVGHVFFIGLYVFIFF